MDQTTNLSTYDRRRAADRLAAFIVQSIDGARAVEKPFFHLEFDRVFPDDIYAQILALMPESSDYRPMHGTRAVADPNGRLTISAPPNGLNRYRFGLRTADYLICRSCGAYVAAVISGNGEERATLNVTATAISELADRHGRRRSDRAHPGLRRCDEP